VTGDRDREYIGGAGGADISRSGGEGKLSGHMAMHLFAADGAAVLAFTWLQGDSAAERFVRTFGARPREQMASLAGPSEGNGHSTPPLGIILSTNHSWDQKSRSITA
jgi:hypothetical protein